MLQLLDTTICLCTYFSLRCEKSCSLVLHPCIIVSNMMKDIKANAVHTCRGHWLRLFLFFTCFLFL